ncbi:adenosylmethionine--8-amino-7-oxononanoate transaminase [Rhodococcus rhodnii]|uniref:Adenosylmethionine-8-amino-7-oxononanoate aminotransferase n=2 Tax=Rhodococcus rhodnii TaxID=38312 RepID=R7WTL4_9NOCA|nr:adenosylmethionine--8-amino-7-oxononanoate transaminase [Rhodococcus rhodnii]EOM78598.1 adenosylmethionine--8-amino-7-oxononanoate [Rhodococcus rhodnii LMG 5362]TXG91379.1 adenosylmethionine--8-amino-7-oxononanoate transaminase [Rhodococcus rhodnii]
MSSITATDLATRDSRILWHPYSRVPADVPPLAVRGASGVRLELDDGRTLIDGMSSWWAAIHGYRHPALDAAAARQLGRMSHVMFGGLTHEPAVELGERLVALTPPGLDRVFFSDSGSVAVEVAVKMCLQYWRSRGRPAKHRLMTWRGGYHGDTFAPMSVCDPDGGMHELWRGVVTPQVFAPVPPREYEPEYTTRFGEVLAAHRDELAAVIVEPVVQGAGGMRFHSPEYLRDLRALCDEHGVLLIFDEIATGFGRTGELFAADHAAVSPDVMCVGKALTGGYVTLAATLCSAAIADRIGSGDAGALMHGPTFMANPLACAIACASLDLLTSRDWRGEVAAIETALTAGLAPLVGSPGVRDIRTLGAIGVVELDAPVDMQVATTVAVDHGVWLRPFRNLVYAMPPFVCTTQETSAIAHAMAAVAAG